MDLFTTQERADLVRQHGVSEAAVDAIARAAAMKVNPLDRNQPNAREITKVLAEKRSDIYRDAFKAGGMLTAHLERLDPSERYHDGLDAYERQLKVLNIRTRSVPEKGIYADRVEKFFETSPDNPSMANLTGNRFYMSDSPASIVLFPEFINRQLRVSGQILPSLLDQMVAITTGIDSAVYDTFYLNLDANQLNLRRTGEAADMPTAELTGAQRSIRLRKYGRRLVGSYETYRRMSIDRFAFHLQQLAIQASVDKSRAALDTIINGDGNSGTAATSYNQTAVQGGVGTDPLSTKGWLSFNLNFIDPYKISTVIAQSDSMLQLLLLNMGTFNIPFAQFQNLQQGLGSGFSVGEPVNMNQTIRLFQRSFAPSSTLVAFDNSRALEMVTEIGADIVETDKIISRQLNEIVISEVVGFTVLDPLASRVLVLGA